MTRPAYSFYTDKMWRFFLRRQWRLEHDPLPSDFLSHIDHENYEICLSVWSRMTDLERDIIRAVYSAHDQDAVKVAVTNCANQYAMTPEAVFKTAHRLSRNVAIKKKLVAE